MSAPAASRLVLRHSRFVFRQHGCIRNASTTSGAAQAASETATKSKETVSNISSRASEGLSRVTSSAGPALNGAAQRVNGVLSRVGGRTGRLISFTRSLIPPAIYYSKVGFELSKLVFRGQKMSPPSFDVFQSYFSSFVNVIRHPKAFFSAAENSANSVTLNGILGRIRNVNRQQLVSAGIISAEVLGFFTVGEIIGRLKLVGYRGEVEHH